MNEALGRENCRKLISIYSSWLRLMHINAMSDLFETNQLNGQEPNHENVFLNKEKLETLGFAQKQSATGYCLGK